MEGSCLREVVARRELILFGLRKNLEEFFDEIILKRGFQVYSCFFLPSPLINVKTYKDQC